MFNVKENKKHDLELSGVNILNQYQIKQLRIEHQLIKYEYSIVTYSNYLNKWFIKFNNKNHHKLNIL